MIYRLKHLDEGERRNKPVFNKAILFSNVYFVNQFYIPYTIVYGGLGIKLNGFSTSYSTRWWLVFAARANGSGDMIT